MQWSWNSFDRKAIFGNCVQTFIKLSLDKLQICHTTDNLIFGRLNAFSKFLRPDIYCEANITVTLEANYA